MRRGCRNAVKVHRADSDVTMPTHFDATFCGNRLRLLRLTELREFIVHDNSWLFLALSNIDIWNLWNCLDQVLFTNLLLLFYYFLHFIFFKLCCEPTSRFVVFLYCLHVFPECLNLILFFLFLFGLHETFHRFQLIDVGMLAVSEELAVLKKDRSGLAQFAYCLPLLER